jgi:hypothetical protein
MQRQVNVQIPLPSDVLPSNEINDIFNHKMLAPTNRKTKVSAGIFHHNGAWWTRCSAQIWTEVRFPSFVYMRCVFSFVHATRRDRMLMEAMYS